MGQVAVDRDEDWDLVARLAADLHDAHARLVELMRSVLAEGTWEGRGLRSPEHFLVLRAGLSHGQAKAIVLLARRSEELPETSRALQEGRISLDQAAVVARHTPTEFDTTVAEFAQYATVPQLQRSVAKYQFETPTPTDEGLPTAVIPPTPEPDEPATLTMHHADGRFTLRYDAPSDIGALVEAALEEAKDWLFQQRSSEGTDHGPSCPVDAATPAERGRVTWADALAVLANRSLDAVEVTGRRSKYRVNVFLDTDGGWLGGKPRLPRHVVDGLTCDGQLVPVWLTEGVPVNVGRAHRVVPERTRRLVVDRDRGCRFPGCAATAFVEIHHLVHWADGGPTDLDNLMSLCPFHHDGHHRREFTISGDPTRHDGLVFRSARGLLIGPPIRPRPHLAYSSPPGGASAASTSGAGSQLSPPHLEGERARPGAPSVPAEDPPTELERCGSPAAAPALALVQGSALGGASGTGARPTAKLGKAYPAPAGETLHVHLVDFTPSAPPGAWPHQPTP